MSYKKKLAPEFAKKIAYKLLYRDCLPPFPRRGRRLIYFLLVVGDIISYIRLDFPKVTASSKHGVVIKRDRPGTDLF